MAHVTLRPQAELDIQDIWEFIAADSIRADDQWVDDLDQNGDVAPSVLGVVDGASNEFGVGLRMYARRSPDGRACPGQSSFDGEVLHSAGFALRHSPVDFNGPCVRHLRVDREAGEKPLRQVGAVFGRQPEGLRFKVCNAGGHNDTPQAEPGHDMRARAGTDTSTGKAAVPRREMP